MKSLNHFTISCNATIEYPRTWTHEFVKMSKQKKCITRLPVDETRYWREKWFVMCRENASVCELWAIRLILFCYFCVHADRSRQVKVFDSLLIEGEWDGESCSSIDRTIRYWEKKQSSVGWNKQMTWFWWITQKIRDWQLLENCTSNFRSLHFSVRSIQSIHV